MYTSSPRECVPAGGVGATRTPADGVSVYDGPFIETKELIAGYIVVSAASLEDAGRWAVQYVDALDADEVDLRELE